MPEVSVFDAYRASRALEGKLAAGDALQSVAIDEVTGSYWCLTKRELLVVKDDAVSARVAIAELSGEVRDARGGVEVRVSDSKSGAVLIGGFRRANKLTRALASLLQDTDPA